MRVNSQGSGVYTRLCYTVVVPIRRVASLASSHHRCAVSQGGNRSEFMSLCCIIRDNVGVGTGGALFMKAPRLQALVVQIYDKLFLV